jgi:HAD superfamily hydrolase (TIGR01509 family)
MVKIIIFDLWKTLAEKNKSIIKSLNDAFPKIKYNDLIKNYESTVQIKKWKNEKEMSKAFLQKFNISLSKKNLDVVENIFLHEYDNSKVYKGVKSLLKSLKKKYKIVLLSNSTFPVEKTFKKLNLDKYFDKVVFSYQIGYTKPNKKSFKYVIDLMNVNYSDCLLVDDNINNINNALKLGIKVYHFDNLINFKNHAEKFL